LGGFIRSRNIDIVIDVGANVGQFAGTLRSHGYMGRIVSFEPLSSAFAELASVARADGNWEAYQVALGAEPGQASIHETDYSVFSSLLPPTNSATSVDPRATVKRTEMVEVRTLDGEAQNLDGNILLKIDTQGYERQVLEGGRETLARARGVTMELPIIHLYEGTWRFHEAVQFMDTAGFVPAQIHPVNYHSKDMQVLVEVDCLFRPRGDRGLD
jgi:FkbM family methyltransferase